MKCLKIALGSTLLAASLSSVAGPITVDAGWYGFCFASGAGNPAVSGCQNDGVGSTGNDITFTLTGPGLLKVTDAFVPGDLFDVFVNGLLAFSTSGAGTGPNLSDPDAAYGSGYYATGSAVLGAGAYTVQVITGTNTGAGGAYIEVESTTAPVPEPGALALVGIAMAGLAWSRRCRATA